jgi:hypothetical protein
LPLKTLMASDTGSIKPRHLWYSRPSFFTMFFD